MEILPRINESCITKMNANVYLLKNINSHYFLLNTTIIPLCNSKALLIFLSNGGNITWR